MSQISLGGSKTSRDFSSTDVKKVSLQGFSLGKNQVIMSKRRAINQAKDSDT